jgi:hypothetical protein
MKFGLFVKCMATHSELTEASIKSSCAVQNFIWQEQNDTNTIVDKKM